MNEQAATQKPTVGQTLKMARDAFAQAAKPATRTPEDRERVLNLFKAYQDASRAAYEEIRLNMLNGNPAIVSLVDEQGKETEVTVGTLGGVVNMTTAHYSPAEQSKIVPHTLCLMHIKGARPG